jgi:hypothetical protein
MSIRKRTQSRDTAVPMGPGEFVDPRDAPRVIAWKRILDVASEEIPEFLPSLLNGDTATWVARWHLPAEGYEGSLVVAFAEETRRHHRIRVSEGFEPEPGFSIESAHLRPRIGYDGVWKLNGRDYPVSMDAHGFELEPLLRDTEGLSLLWWNPFHETRADATERLRGYLDTVLEQVETAVSHDQTRTGHARTPKRPRRHIAWFVRWKFKKEKLYAIAKQDRGEPNAVRDAVDKVADVLQWGYRNGDTGAKLGETS